MSPGLTIGQFSCKNFMLGIGKGSLVSIRKGVGEENRSDSLQTCQKQRLIVLLFIL